MPKVKWGKKWIVLLCSFLYGLWTWTKKWGKIAMAGIWNVCLACLALEKLWKREWEIGAIAFETFQLLEIGRQPTTLCSEVWPSELPATGNLLCTSRQHSLVTGWPNTTSWFQSWGAEGGYVWEPCAWKPSLWKYSSLAGQHRKQQRGATVSEKPQRGPRGQACRGW